ncbi:hypothetical protein GCM10009591_06040 [Brachybacterium tyrofermentans]
MSNAASSPPALDAFCCWDGLGLTATGQRVKLDRAVLDWRVLEADSYCRRCGQAGVPRGTGTKTVVHVPLGWRPTMLQVRVHRYRCSDYCTVWRQDTTTAAATRTKPSRDAVYRALKSVVIDRISIARVAENLSTVWHTTNGAALKAVQELLINDPARFDGVRAIGADDHVWSHTRGGSKYITVIIDPTQVRRRQYQHREAADNSPGRLEKGLQGLARRPESAIQRRDRDCRHGWVHRLQDCCRGRDAPGRGGDGPLPRRRPGRRCTGPVPVTGPAGHLRVPRALEIVSTRSAESSALARTSSPTANAAG